MASIYIGLTAPLALLCLVVSFQPESVQGLHGSGSAFDHIVGRPENKPQMPTAQKAFIPTKCEDYQPHYLKKYIQGDASQSGNLVSDNVLRVRGGSEAAFASASMMAANPEMAKQFFGSNLISQSRKIGTIHHIAHLLDPRAEQSAPQASPSSGWGSSSPSSASCSSSTGACALPWLRASILAAALARIQTSIARALVVPALGAPAHETGPPFSRSRPGQQARSPGRAPAPRLKPPSAILSAAAAAAPQDPRRHGHPDAHRQ